MTEEQKFFIHMLCDHLRDQTTAPQVGLDWDTLTTYAKSHQVSGILFHQCRAFIPTDQQKAFSELHAAELFYYYNRIAQFQELHRELSKAGIDYFTVKGLDIAGLYPIPALRTMGDCDIIVREGEKERAHEVLMALGYENYRKDCFEWMYMKNDIHMELHDRLLYDQTANTENDLKFAKSVWDYTEPSEGTRYTLDWSFHFLFLLLHLKKHLIHEGAGFRQFMDLVLVIRRCKLDWVWIEDRLTELELLPFARVCFALMKEWFELDPPLEPAKLDETFLGEAERIIFANGIFGFDNPSNRDNARMHELSEAQGPRWIQRIRMLTDFMFPSYQTMCDAPNYVFLRGRPWLLPVGWIVRAAAARRSRKLEGGKRFMRSAFTSNEELEKRKQSLTRWGL